VQIAIHDQKRQEFPALADVAIKEAEGMLQRMVSLQAKPEFADSIRKAIDERRNRR
jgi:hypothetical protein